MNAPTFGDRVIGDAFRKHSYPLSIMVNANGERFVDECADFRNFTYAKYGVEVRNSPGCLRGGYALSRLERTGIADVSRRIPGGKCGMNRPRSHTFDYVENSRVERVAAPDLTHCFNPL